MLMTQPIQKLTDSRDFQNIARNARRWTGSCFVVQARARELVPPRGSESEEKPTPFRFGLTASRKVGNAVVRNRCKRRLREVVRALVRESAACGHVVAGYDVVIIARTCCATVDYAVLQDDMKRAWRHLGVLPK